MSKTKITVSYGDGIGPEIMEATLKILDHAGANLEYDVIEIGEKVYLRGNLAGIEDASWDKLTKNKVFLKAPITTPQGGGFKSLNVTVRKSLGLYANVRPCRSYYPFINNKHPKMDVVIIRENEEDLYAGIEHRQTEDVYQCLKIISRSGCEKIIRYAFEYAVRNKRKKVTCFTKDNIMKMTDGLFHKVFLEIGEEYPQIEKEHWIVDIGAAKLADTPEVFDVIVMPNLYGDILSDVAAQIAGSVGLAGSANIGEEVAMFEAIHGSAPRRAGQNMANPTGLIMGAVQMLVHLGKGDVAEKVHNALLKTFEDGIHTYDIFDANRSKQKVSTSEFTQAVIERLGQLPAQLEKVSYANTQPLKIKLKESKKAVMQKDLIGVDVFVDFKEKNPELLSEKVRSIAKDLPLDLEMITNRGVKVWPNGKKETFCTDHWRCRFKSKSDSVTNHAVLWMMMREFSLSDVEVIKTENLYHFDGEKGYSLGQGQ